MQRGGRAAGRPGCQYWQECDIPEGCAFWEGPPPLQGPPGSLGGGGGLAGVGYYTEWAGALQYVPGTYLGSSLRSLPFLPLLPTRYRLTAALPSADRLPCNARGCPCPRFSNRVVSQGCSPINEHPREQYDFTPTILCRASLT